MTIATALLLTGTVACSGTQSPATSPTVAATAIPLASPTAIPLASPTAVVTPTALPSIPTSPIPTATPAAPTPTSAGGVFSLLPSEALPDSLLGISCAGAIGAADPVAVVQLAPKQPGLQGDIVLRDYADPAHPRTACTFGGEPRVEQLIDPHHVVVQGCPQELGCRAAVVDLPDVRYHWFALPTTEDGYSTLLAVSPGLDEVAWISSANYGTDRHLHLTRADGDQVVADLFPEGGRCGMETDSAPAAYSRSGGHLAVLDVPDYQTAVFLVFAGSREVLAFRPPSGGWQPDSSERPVMPVWAPSGESLYYAQHGDVERWTPDGGIQTFLAGVVWLWPTISPDGRYLAYAVGEGDGTHDTYLMDLQAGSAPRLIGQHRTTPVFLTDTQLWEYSEDIGVCGPGLKAPLIYDVNEGDEAPSIIDWVHHVWPATSSNFE